MCLFILKPLVYFEYGMKNKRRLMEDKTAIYDNLSLLTTLPKQESIDGVDSSSSSIEEATPPAALFGVFDGHCGADCSQYVSTHLPLAILQNSGLKAALESTSEAGIRKIFNESFKTINNQFTAKAREEVGFIWGSII
jgi:serine/threonine protein phosphatase PrpC